VSPRARQAVEEQKPPATQAAAFSREEVLPGGVGGPAPVIEPARRYGDGIAFDDVLLIDDEQFLYEKLDALTVERGEPGVDAFVAGFEQQIAEEARSSRADENAADVSAGWSENIEIARARASEARARADVERAILLALKRAHLRLRAENRQFLADFEGWGNDLVRAILAQSDALLDEQVRRYGIRGTERTETYYQPVRDREVRKERLVTDWSMSETPDTASLAYATSELAVKRAEIRKLEQKRVYEEKRARDPEAKTWTTSEVLKWDPALEAEIATREQEYEALRLRQSREHPILRVADKPLVGLTARDDFPSPRAARAIVEAVAERKGNIQEVRDEIGGRYSIWAQPVILAMTSQQHGVVAGSRQDMLVRDKFRSYKPPREVALTILTGLVLALGLAAAAFTLGGSTVIAAGIAAAIAGIDFAVLGDAIAQYQVDLAATETDLDPQQSVSQTKPTAAEILFDSVAVLADLIALGAELRAAGAGARGVSAAAHAPELARFGAGEGAGIVRLTERELAVLQKETMAGFAGAEGRLARTASPTYLVRIGKAGAGEGFSRWGFAIFKDEAAAAAYARWLATQPEEVLRSWTAIPQLWSPASGSAFETIKVWKLPEGVAYVGGRVGPQLEGAKVFADVAGAKSAQELLEAGRLARAAPVPGGGAQVLLLGDIKGFSQVGSELPVLAASGKAARAEARLVTPIAKAAVVEAKTVAAEGKAAKETEAVTTAAGTKEPEWFTKPEEVLVSREEYERALAHGYVPQAFDRLASAIHEIGERTAAVVTQNPRFVQAVNSGDWKLAGTLFHAEAARQGPIVAQRLGQSFQLQFTLRFEEQLAGGASRLDILASTPSGLVEVDWKTTGRSGLSWRVRVDEMPRHATHVVQDYGVPLSQQLSKSWVDYVRPYMPNVRWPK
jgi:hypothetical protein